MIVVSADFGKNDTTSIVISERDPDGRLRVLHTWSGSIPPPTAFNVRMSDGTMRAVVTDTIQLELELRRRRVSAEIIDRVMRLNPSPNPYEKPRGIHYKETGRFRLNTGLGSKGYVIRTFGREVWDRIPRSAYIKEGRRIFVHARTVMEAMR